MSRFDQIRIAILKDETLWKGWSHFRRIVFDYIRPDDSKVELEWEVFDRGEAEPIRHYGPIRRGGVIVAYCSMKALKSSSKLAVSDQ